MKWILLSLLVTPMAFAAIPNPKKQVNQIVLQKLHGPHSIAKKEIFSLGPKGYIALHSITFDSHNSMKTRWKAFMIMTSIGGKKSLPEIKKALYSKEWFLRSAGLLAMEKVNQKIAVKWAAHFLKKDEALMVRAQAIDILRNDPSPQNIKLVWKKLYSKENFHRGHGLWIRKNMAHFLSDHAGKSFYKSWARALHDKDVGIQQIAANTMARISGVNKIKAMSNSKRLSYLKSRYPRKKRL